MIIYEDNHLLVVHKPPGILVQGDRTGDPTILDYYKQYIKKKYDKKGNVFLHPAHRLDRPVSGCLVLARTSKGLSRMTGAFKAGTVIKTYHALTPNRSSEPSGKLVDYLYKNKDRNLTKVVSETTKGAKEAILSYRLVTSLVGGHLLEIRPLTGRSHQIRVQLAHLGCPIFGDVKYGGPVTGEDRMIYLHCSQMIFVHPTKSEEVIVNCIPNEGSKWPKFRPYLIES